MHAEEGPLAIAAGSSPALGTDPILLARAINNLYGPAGIHCEYRYVRDLNALTLPAIANIFSPAFGGHYIAVLQVTPDYLFVGDPLGEAREKWTRQEFMAEWTGAAHEFTFNPAFQAKRSAAASPLSAAATSP
jgi:ABC-type bacteriocin/lantibiotic exporter with double-glycine peptidase domain